MSRRLSKRQLREQQELQELQQAEQAGSLPSGSVTGLGQVESGAPADDKEDAIKDEAEGDDGAETASPGGKSEAREGLFSKASIL